MSDQLWDIATSGNLNEVLANIRARLTALERRETAVNELSDLTAEVGELSSGVDWEGEELADAGWGANTSLPALTVYTTDRMAVNEFALMEFRVDMTPPYRIYKLNENGIRSYLKIAWYDALSGGSELSRDDLAFWGGVTFRRTLTVPAGAVACAFVCGISSSNVYGLATNAVSGFSAHEFTRANRLTLAPLPSVQVEGNWARLAGGEREIAPPAGHNLTAALVTTGTGNLTNGAYCYRITWVDEYGETTPGTTSNTVVVDATHKQITVTAPQPIPLGASSWRIYRTLVDVVADTDPFYRVATVAAGVASYQDNIADVSLVTLAPEANTTLGRPVLPTSARQMANSMRSRNGLTWTANASQVHGEYWRTADDALGDWMAPDPALLEPGRYEMTLLSARATTGGKVDVFMDGQLIGVVDLYNGSTAFNYLPTVNFVVEEPGWHEFLFKVNGSSASGYRLFLTEYWARRTGR